MVELERDCEVGFEFVLAERSRGRQMDRSTTTSLALETLQNPGV